ncbi:hypothetical protein [Aquimonas sp.]|uniref:hypothetical protein n=1 Tax=Aquimonas sp. TaxID=1872588 RepID=UPI0037BF087C
MSTEHPHRAALILLPTLAASAVALLLARRLLPEHALLDHPLLPLWCVFVFTYVGAATLSLLPAPLGRPIDRMLDRHLSQWGAGVYGLIALSFFLRLELLSLIEGLRETREGAEWVQGMLREWLIGFSVESLKNAISAAIWPTRIIAAHGVQSFLLFFAAASAVFELGRRVMPEQQARLEQDTPRERKKASRKCQRETGGNG